MPDGEGLANRAVFLAIIPAISHSMFSGRTAYKCRHISTDSTNAVPHLRTGL